MIMAMVGYEFSSNVKIEENERVNHMHVLAADCKLDDLQGLVEQHLKVTFKEEIHLEWGSRDVEYLGSMEGTDYKVLLEYGACPTLDGGEGHNVEIRTPLKEEDKLSSIIEEEMRKYETELTQQIQKKSVQTQQRLMSDIDW